MSSLYDIANGDPDYIEVKDGKTVLVTKKIAAVNVTIKTADPCADENPRRVAFCGVMTRYGLLSDSGEGRQPCSIDSARERDNRRTRYFEAEIKKLEERQRWRRVELDRLHSDVSMVARAAIEARNRPLIGYAVHHWPRRRDTVASTANLDELDRLEQLEKIKELEALEEREEELGGTGSFEERARRRGCVLGVLPCVSNEPESLKDVDQMD